MVFGAIGSAVSSAASALSSAVSTGASVVESAVSTTVETMMGPIKEIAEAGLEILKTVVDIIEGVAKSLGLIESDTEPEELGDKAIQFEEETGNTIDDFETYEEYQQELDEFELDPERSEELTEGEKLAKGLEIMTKKLEEKLDTKLDKLLVEVAKKPDFYDQERVETYLEEFSATDVDINDLQGTGDFELDNKITQTRLAAEKKLNPDLSQGEILDKLDQIDD